MKRYIFIFSMLATLSNAADFDKGYECATKGDYSCALKEWVPLANNGDPSSQYSLGVIYQNGNGVKPDINEAIKWYEQAADQGVLNAQYNLGKIYADNNNYSQAMKRFQEAARQGDDGAQLEIGILHANGDGVDQNDLEAKRWFELSAGNDNGKAMYFLGDMYANGYGVDVDANKAAKLFERACRKGVTKACTLFNDDCDAKMSAYLDMAEINPDKAINELKNNTSKCEDKDVITGTIYVMAGDLNAGEKYYLKAVNENKSLAFAYWQLAGLELSRGNTNKVLDYCDKSLTVELNYMCFRHAVIAFTSTGDYQRARNMYKSAYELNANLFSDSDVVGAAIYAYTELGEIELAKGLVVLGIKNNPEAKNSSIFVQAYQNLKLHLPTEE